MKTLISSLFKVLLLRNMMIEKKNQKNFILYMIIKNKYHTIIILEVNFPVLDIPKIEHWIKESFTKSKCNFFVI